MNEFDFGGPTRRRSGPAGPSLALVVTGLAVCSAVIGGALFLATKDRKGDDAPRPEAPRKPAGQVAQARPPADRPAPPPKKPPQPQPPLPRPADPPAPTITARERDELRRALLRALQDRERRLREQSRRLGALTEADRRLGLQAALLIKKHGLARATPDMIALARAVAPDWVRKKQRDEDLEPVRLRKAMGKELNEEERQLLRRPPPGQREASYKRFAELTGLKDEWSLLVPFDDLTEEEMGHAITAAWAVNRDGLGSIDQRERLLLVRTGALEWLSGKLKALGP